MVGDLADCGSQPDTDPALGYTLHFPADRALDPREGGNVVLWPRFAVDEADCTFQVVPAPDLPDGFTRDGAEIVAAFQAQRPGPRRCGEARRSCPNLLLSQSVPHRCR